MANILAAAVKDFGPLYAETDLSRFPVEPLNTYSNLAFLIIVVYWGTKTKLNWRKHQILVLSLPILLVGFIGGTLFHATRSSRIWLIMDFMPIFILTVLASLYFWHQYLKSLKSAFFATASIFLLLSFLRHTLELPRGIVFSLGYASLAVGTVVPAILCSYKAQWSGIKYILEAVLSFTVAIIFRVIDGGVGKELLPSGTHFLWHLFGATSSHLIMAYIYKLDLLVFHEKKE